jgi:hypothetical protein
VTAPVPRRPWRKRKRTWAAVLWLAAAYPASFGPAAYVCGITGMSFDPLRVVYFPVIVATAGYPTDEEPMANRWYRESVNASYRLGKRHAASH